jgi:hypothetical protein
VLQAGIGRGVLSVVIAVLPATALAFSYEMLLWLLISVAIEVQRRHRSARIYVRLISTAATDRIDTI